MVEGARDGARRLVILMHISFSPLLQGARRCVWRRRRQEGQRHSSGEGRSCWRFHWAVSVQYPHLPKINKVGVVARVEEFDEDLAQDCPELPRLATWLLHAYPGAPTLSALQRLGVGGGNARD